MRRTVLRAAAGAVLLPVVAVPASAHACSIASLTAEAVAPAESASVVQTSAPVPVRVRFASGGSSFSPVQFGVARLNATAEIETVVETGQLNYDAATGTWYADANGNGWALTPGEYVWQASATQNIPASPPVEPDANGVVMVNTCGGPYSIVHDGRWVHRLTVLGASAVTAKARKARHGRAKVSGTVAKTFSGKVRLTVACPGKRARTTLVATGAGRWSRTVHAKHGCRIVAAVAARPGWAASETSARVR
ncbi:MAG TPA: hypothetical protein VNS09_22685 [Solirubrobacter sp.]|nr:hypothetical protein [Solirubrobacter sp.]